MRDDAVDLSRYRLPLQPMPAQARAVHAQGIQRQEFPRLPEAHAALLHQPPAFPDGIYRAADGTALVRCTTRMAYVTPAMIRAGSANFRSAQLNSQ